jgi:hypothetical protein
MVRQTRIRNQSERGFERGHAGLCGAFLEVGKTDLKVDESVA